MKFKLKELIGAVKTTTSHGLMIKSVLSSSKRWHKNKDFSVTSELESANWAPANRNV
jgi:hypothetical protein